MVIQAIWGGKHWDGQENIRVFTDSEIVEKTSQHMVIRHNSVLFKIPKENVLGIYENYDEFLGK